MKDESISSEEKLLKLIRKKGQDGKDYVGKSARKNDVSSPASRETSKGILPFKFSAINRFLMIICLGLLAYIAGQWFLVETKEVQDIVLERNVMAQETLKSSSSKSDIKPFSYYAEKFEGRDIFDTSFKGKESPADIMASVAADPTKRLKIVGIILDRKPQAIIENTRTKETMFLNQGDTFEDVTVKEIKESKVVLVYQGQSYTLEQ